jgi:hypothetical protein
MNGEHVRVGKEVPEAQLKVQEKDSPEETEENLIQSQAGIW